MMKWTKAQEQFIRDNYKHMSDASISIELSRISNTLITPKKVADKRCGLGLMKRTPKPKVDKPKRPRGRPRKDDSI